MHLGDSVLQRLRHEVCMYVVFDTHAKYAPAQDPQIDIDQLRSLRRTFKILVKVEMPPGGKRLLALAPRSLVSALLLLHATYM